MIPYSRVYRDLALAYGWTPQEVNRMTPYQIVVYMGGAVPEEKTTRMSLDEAIMRGLLKGKG